MILKIKKLTPEAVIPTRAHESDAGLDLTATSVNNHGKVMEYGTGLAIAIPEGYVGLIFPRSSISAKDLSLTNSVGVIDSGYRGEIKFKFGKTNYQNEPHLQRVYAPGDRIGQLVILKLPEFEVLEVNDLDETDRGTGGFGSSGN